MKIRIACIQMAAGDHFDRNLHQAIVLAHEAHHKGAELIAYPEMFLYRGSATRYPNVLNETEAVLHKFQHIACFSRVPILMGSVLERSKSSGRYYNTSIFISEKGQLAARYRKIHLFDVKTPGKKKVEESKYFLPGKTLSVASLLGIQFGLGICFDLRFPEQFRALSKKGAEIIFLPSNFLEETGKAHWHALLRARAIENQVFVVAPAQVGRNPKTGIKSYGHSLIVDPWGKIIAEGSGNKSEIVIADIDTAVVAQLRKNFPVI